MLKKIVLASLFLQTLGLPLFAQERTNVSVLARMAKETRRKEQENFRKTLLLAKEKGWDLSYKTKTGNIAFLIGVDHFGYPVYYTTENNITAAATTRANVLWPGGSSGLGLTGDGANMKDKMALWDGGSVLATHVELTGRVKQKDSPSSIEDHSTHVAGTLVASGVNPNAKGMAYDNQELIAYDFNNDVSEMSAEAGGLLLSNHSYGAIAGWYFNDGQNRWEFWGRAGDKEDYKFGYYDLTAQMFDSIAYNAPYYLIVKSSGNNRTENGPAVGQNYWRRNSSGVMSNAGTRPAGISDNNSFDVIATYAVAKNILTVGAVNGLAYGYTRKEDVVMTGFSNWGPTDDGRIKPDIVADGVDLLSSIALSTTSYASYSGTSMAAPNVTGSLLLLQEYYAQLHSGSFMRSATLKALAIHTADESGTAPGPDYQFGWGLLNVARAAELIRSNNTGPGLIYEQTLNNGGSYSTTVIASGKGPLVATIAWTDPKGDVNAVNVLNDHTRKLVNDLDIRITGGAVTYQPWVLNPFNPSAAAITGDNVLDNVERINIDDVVPGQAYTITVTHKGILERGSQAFSLIISGAGGHAYCTSTPASNAGAKIDSVDFGNIHKKNTPGCTGYTNYTDLSTPVEPGKTLPLSVQLGSCDASANPRIVKAYIDYNSDGDFSDAGELVATSAAISGNGICTTNVTIPNTVTSGNAAILRIVCQETSNETDVNPCGNFGNGETQDYRISFSAPSNDISIVDVVAPVNGSCSSPSQLLTIGLRNNGNADRSNIPLSVVIRNGATTVATLSATEPVTISASNVTAYTFQTAFATEPGVNYHFEIVASDPTDQNPGNDTLRKDVAIVTAPPQPAASAEICGAGSILKVAGPNSSSNYFWYTAPSGDSSIARGATALTTVIPSNHTYYTGTGAKGTIGLSSKSQFPGGGDYLSATANYMKYSATVPVVIETAKLYTKYPGKIDFIVADILSTTSTGYTYQIISSTTIDVYATSPNKGPGLQNGEDVADNGADFYLNLYLPAGDHAIIVRPQGDANIFRNNNVTGDPYPFALPNLISFTGNSATTAGDPNFYQGFYYYLYNVKLHTVDCISDRIAVVASVAPTPAISQEGDSLVSSLDNGNQWYLNGAAISGANSKKFKPTQSGNYTAVWSDNFGCVRTSSALSVVITAVVPVDLSSREPVISPNPNRGSFLIQFKAIKKEDLKIDMINVQGQRVYRKTYPGFRGDFSEQFDLKTLAAGVYILKLQHGKNIFYRKVIIGNSQ
jgi:hypothetical protein